MISVIDIIVFFIKTNSLLSASNKGNYFFFFYYIYFIGNWPCSVRLYRVNRVINNCFLMLKLDDRLKKNKKYSCSFFNFNLNLAHNRPVQTTRWWLVQPHVLCGITQLWTPEKRLRWDVRQPWNLCKKCIGGKICLIYCLLILKTALSPHSVENRHLTS